MDKYRLSKYNCFLRIKDAVVGVNLCNKTLFSISLDKYEQLEKYKSSLEILEEENPILFSAMYKLGIIEEVSVNFSNMLLMKNRATIFDNKYHLVINPTLNCNFSCWYCYESHNKSIMEKSTMQAIIKFIEYIVKDLHIKYLHIEWFGGEPLLCFENRMKPISIEAKRICSENNAYFDSGITTNGFFIKKEMMPFFKEHNFKNFQITLDGKRDTHNLVRVHNGTQNSYDKIVQNICLVASESIDVSMRINYTHDSIDDCVEIIDSIPVELREKISVGLVQVWQDKRIQEVSFEKFNKIYEIFKQNGFRVNTNIFNCKSFICYADLYNEAVINYDGKVFKCTTNDFGKDKEEGILTDEGRIIWDEVKLSKRLSRATFDNKNCIQCKYLPICSGRCSEQVFIREENIMSNCPFKPRFNEKVRLRMKQFKKSGMKLGYLIQ